MNESQARDRIAQYGKSIFDRGLTAGTSGNISVKVGDGWLMTPTNSSLGDLDPATLSRLPRRGEESEGKGSMESIPLKAQVQVMTPKKSPKIVWRRFCPEYGTAEGAPA